MTEFRTMLNARQPVEWAVVRSRLPRISASVRAKRGARAERQRCAVRVYAAASSSSAAPEANVSSTTDSSTNAIPDTAPSAPAKRTSSSSKKKEKGIHFRELRDEQGEVYKQTNKKYNECNAPEILYEAQSLETDILFFFYFFPRTRSMLRSLESMRNSTRYLTGDS